MPFGQSLLTKNLKCNIRSFHPTSQLDAAFMSCSGIFTPNVHSFAFVFLSPALEMHLKIVKRSAESAAPANVKSRQASLLSHLNPIVERKDVPQGPRCYVQELQNPHVRHIKTQNYVKCTCAQHEISERYQR